MLYIFDKDDKFKNIITEETGLIDTWFKDYQNHVPDESFLFHVDSESELLHLIVEENQVAFYDRDDDLRLMRIKETYETVSSEGSIITAKCEPSFLELYDHFIEDRRFVDETSQKALNAALQDSRYIGEVTAELGLATTNFYWINAFEAIFKILKVWGGALKDTITLDDNNEITERKIWIVQRLGKDRGLIVETDYNAEQIERKTLSYPHTALWGQGASLEILDDEGNHTGGYTRYITFEDVEWSKAKGDPVDKPKGQKWIGDPDALQKYGYLHNGVRKHRFGHFSNQDYNTPEELLWSTWKALQEQNKAEISHEALIDVQDKKVSLGDTVTILARQFNKPIELQSQITGLEYDILDADKDVRIVIGKYVDMNENPTQAQLDSLENTVNSNRGKWDIASKPITNDRFPDIRPKTPVNVKAIGGFQTIQLYWDFDHSVYISHYEVYGSQVDDFVPDSQHLLWRGRVSSFAHEVESDQMWHYYVRAVNTRGTASEFSEKVSETSVRVVSDDILFGSVLSEHLADNLDLANKLSQGTLDYINNDPLSEIRQTEERLLSDIDTKVDYVEYFDAMINVNNKMNKITLSVSDVQGEVDSAMSQISMIDLKADNLSLSVSELERDLTNLEIGARNFIRYSDMNSLDGWEANGLTTKIEMVDGFIKTMFSGEGIETPGILSRYPISLEKGIYTLTVRLNTDNLTSPLRFALIGDSQSTYLGDEIPKKAGWNTVSVNFKIDRDREDDHLFLIALLPNEGEFVMFDWVKLEKGNKATDWTPAPEDLADKDGLISYINLSTEGIRIHGEKIHITGQTLIEDGVVGTAAIADAAIDRFHLKNGIIDNVHIADATIEGVKIKDAAIDTAHIANAAVTDAKIASLRVDKLTGNIATFIQDNWNGISNEVKINGIGLETYYGGNLTSRLLGAGHDFYRDGRKIGRIGTSYWLDNQNHRGLSFQMTNTCSYMAWSHDDNGDDIYTPRLIWYKDNQLREKGFHLEDNVRVGVNNVLHVRKLSTTGFGDGNRHITIINTSFDGNSGVSFVRGTDATGARLHLSASAGYLLSNGTAYIKVGQDSTGNYVQSIDIYNRRYTNAPNLYVTGYGTLGLTSSSRRYKLLEEPIAVDYANRILDLDVKSWFDKQASENYAKSLEGEDAEILEVRRIPGVIAEDVHAVGLDMFVEYDDYGRPDRVSQNLPLLILPVLKDFKRKTEDDIEYLKLENQYLKQKISLLEEKIQ